MRATPLAELRDDALHAALVVVGSGPAGLTIARELAGPGADVLVLESGGVDPRAEADALNEIESVGAPRVMDQSAVRNRVVGGTSSTWSGRSVQLDPIDFEARPWVPGSGWPITRAELEPWFAAAAAHLGCPVPDNGDPAFVARVTDDLPRADPGDLVPYAWSLSRDAARPAESMRFGPRALADPMPGIRLATGATVVEVETAEDGRVTGLVVVDDDGARRRIATARVVLAGGAIENARLLLASRGRSPAGLGNESGLVGRFLMDHLRGPVAVADPADHAGLQRRFGDRLLPSGGRATPGWALSRAIQERESLLGCAAWLFPTVAEDDPFGAVRAAGPARALVAAARHPVLVGAGVVRLRFGHALPVRRLDRMELHVIVEQAPDAESRIVLAGRSDAHGVPISRIDWRVGEQEVRTARRTTRLVLDVLDRAGFRSPRLLPLVEDGAPFNLPDVAHPIGTTRMAADPAHGVVDPDCAVHGVPGLWVAGSSVFPTGGHANPTGTIVALAVRLAAHLRALAA